MTTTVTRIEGNKIAHCRGANHARHWADRATCDGCGVHVALHIPESGNWQDQRVHDVTVSMEGRWSYVCWKNVHMCNEDTAKRYQASKAARIADGEIIKGATVTVVRGRKVPIGTTGVVVWVGQDAYGKGRIGLRVDSQTLWIASSNVEVAA